MAHLCGNPACIYLMHLVPKTRKENHQDMIDHGRSTKGESNPQAILTEEQVKEIWYSYVPGIVTQQELADQFGVDRKVVSMIVHGHRWAHVTSELKGGGRKGHKGSALTEEQVKEIWFAYKPGKTSYQQLAARFGVMTGAVAGMMSGKYWSHVTKDLPPHKKYDRSKHTKNQHAK